MEGKQEKQRGALFFASDKLENLLLRCRASESTVMPSCLRGLTQKEVLLPKQRCSRPAPDEQAPRSAGGVCEPPFRFAEGSSRPLFLRQAKNHPQGVVCLAQEEGLEPPWLLA